MTEGTQEGDRCNRSNDDGFACDGTMDWPESAPGCECYGDSGPCRPCQAMKLTCDVCDAVVEE